MSAAGWMLSLLLPASGATPELEADGPIRGMTISCPMNGEIWGTPAFSQALEAVKAVGVNWVAIHPYARIRADGTVRHHPAASSAALVSAVERARAAGVKLFLKPHLAYWGAFSWRGAITFRTPSEWDRFFESYEAFIVDQARFAAAHRIPLLAVGVELDATTEHESRWRQIIRKVRAIYPARITYAANWDRVMSTPFWDAVDLIGAQAYHPLALKDASPASVHEAWRGAVQAIEGLNARFGKQVLFTEIGYPDAPHAARTPWKPRGWSDPAAPGLRRVLIEVAARDIQGHPGVAGMFWWKWIPGRRSGRDFAMETPEARAILGAAWRPARPVPRAPLPQPETSAPPLRPLPEAAP